MKYLVKSHFYGWKEVPYENYLGYIKNIMDNATAMNESQKSNYIKKVTKIEKGR